MTQNATCSVPFVVASAPWCHDVRGVAYTFDQYLVRITAFHGYPDLADNKFMEGGLDLWDPAGGAIAYQAHFVAVSKADNK